MGFLKELSKFSTLKSNLNEEGGFGLGEFIQALTENQSLAMIPKLIFFGCSREGPGARPDQVGNGFTCGPDMLIGLSSAVATSRDKY